jgi:hypothetical protein
MENKGELIINIVNNESNPDFYEALFSLNEKNIDSNIAKVLTEISLKCKQLDIKYKCIKLLYNKNYEFLKEYFETMYNKTRYPDMKIPALRGLLQFVTEQKLKKYLINSILS